MRNLLQLITFSILAYCANTTLAHATCTNPAGVAGEIIFNVDHKVLQFCNSEKWMALGGSTRATGSNGEIQFNNAGKLGASNRLHWTGSDLELNGNILIHSNASNIRRLIIAGKGASTGQSYVEFQRTENNRATGLLFKNADNDINWHFGHAYRGGSQSNDLQIVEDSSRYDETGTLRFTIQKGTGNVNIGPSFNPTEKLVVQGNIKAAPGNALMTDMIFAEININTATPSPVNGITCTHNGGTYPKNTRTDCACPSGYYIFTGGGYVGDSNNGTLQASRPINLTTWRVACKSNDGTDYQTCANATIICARIKPNP